MAEKKAARVNVYLPERVGRFADGHPSRSARLAVIVDRYTEALRRMKIHERFSEPELRVLQKVLEDWEPEPAAVVFDGLLFEVRAQGVGTPVLQKKLEVLSAFDLVALIESLEARARERAQK